MRPSLADPLLEPDSVEPEPDGSFPIGEDGLHARLLQPVLRAPLLPLPVLAAKRDLAIVAAGPDAATLVLCEAADVSSRPPGDIRRRPCFRSPTGEEHPSAASADPGRAVPRDDHRGDPLGERIRSADGHPARRAAAEDAILAGQPDPPLRTARQGGDAAELEWCVRRAPLGLVGRSEPHGSVRIDYPDVPLRVLGHIEHGPGRDPELPSGTVEGVQSLLRSCVDAPFPTQCEPRGGPPGRGSGPRGALDASAIEGRHAIEGRDPQDAIAVLQQTRNRELGQPCEAQLIQGAKRPYGRQLRVPVGRPDETRGVNQSQGDRGDDPAHLPTRPAPPA